MGLLVWEFEVRLSKLPRNKEASMKRLIALAACEKRLSGDSPYTTGTSADGAPPVGTVTPASPTLLEVK